MASIEAFFMPLSLRYDWFVIEKPDQVALKKTVDVYHYLIQKVAQVGRSYIDHDPEKDLWSDTLIWIPGLWRMAGQWINGSQKFRSSISLKEFTFFLVDQKINTLASLYVDGQSYNDVMIWLEEQIIAQKLSSNRLTAELPYELPDSLPDQKVPLSINDVPLGNVLGGYFHDVFVLLSSLKEQYDGSTTEIRIFPKRFDMEMKVILKETGDFSTNTYIRLGFSPGNHIHQEPYLYVNSWPYVSASALPEAPQEGFWYQDDWVGLVFPLFSVVGKQNQDELLLSYYQESLQLFKDYLLD